MAVVRTTAAAGNVQESCLGHLAQMVGRKLGQLVVFAHLVGQAGIGMNADIGRHEGRQPFDKRAQLRHTKRAVQSETQYRIVGYADVERLQRLSRQRATTAVVDGGRHHHGNGAP